MSSALRDVQDWVRDQITPLLDTVGGHPLLIAKSLGTNAAALAAERHLPAVWLTPLLTLPWLTAALSRATAPFLLVGGTADAMWDATLASRLSPFVLEIDSADHGLFVPGPLTNSIAVLGRLVTAMDDFMNATGWQPKLLHPPRGSPTGGRQPRTQPSYPPPEALNS